MFNMVRNSSWCWSAYMHRSGRGEGELVTRGGSVSCVWGRGEVGWGGGVRRWGSREEWGGGRSGKEGGGRWRGGYAVLQINMLSWFFPPTSVVVGREDTSGNVS